MSDDDKAKTFSKYKHKKDKSIRKSKKRGRSSDSENSYNDNKRKKKKKYHLHRTESRDREKRKVAKESSRKSSKHKRRSRSIERYDKYHKDECRKKSHGRKISESERERQYKRSNRSNSHSRSSSNESLRPEENFGHNYKHKKKNSENLSTSFKMESKEICNSEKETIRYKQGSRSNNDRYNSSIKESHSNNDKNSKKLLEKTNESEDSEDEILFEWEVYRRDLNCMFFQDDSVIQRGTENYTDFWKFLKKYQALQRQKKIRSMCAKENDDDGRDSIEVSKLYELPKKYDKRYNINFALNITDADNLLKKLPPRDLDEGIKTLSRKKIMEFKYIILLYLDFLQKQKFKKLKKLRETQADLPIAQYRDAIVNTLKDNNVLIVAGDTGCGKSTQVPQYLMAAGYQSIACTQPRRIACISLSKRVAYETLNEYGTQVGYQIRFEKSRTEHTKIVFITEGLLLRQVALDPSLSLYSVIILDEIHERHLHTDFLLGIMKCVLTQRHDIKVILMSATINLELFKNYFMGKAPVIQVPGRLYPISLQYFPIPLIEQANSREKMNPAPYIRILQLIDNKYPEDERGDVLIFLSGISEITTIIEAARVYGQQSNKWIILPLHSTLSVAEQEKVFDIPPEGVRKCIVSTNIAETSITIDGVRFVVDSGKVKEMSYDSQTKMQRLKEFWISQASAEQRKGRAGRTGPGNCFRLYSEEEYSSFLAYSTPEIQRVPLDSLMLQMISMGLPNIRMFPFIEPPSHEKLESSLTSLKVQAALSSTEELTTIGELLSNLPMNISLGKMLIMGSLFNKVGPVLSLAAAMSVQTPFTNRAFRDPDCNLAIKSLESDHGDPFTLLNAYKEWLSIKARGGDNSKRWCRRHGLEEQRFYEMTKLRHQFTQLLSDSGLQDVTGRKSTKNLSFSERVKRKGELQQLHDMKKQLRQSNVRKTKVLKFSHEDGEMSDEDGDNKGDIKDVDFRIKNNQKNLLEIEKSCEISSLSDIMMLKIILCSGLYPQVAIGDLHNNYKQGSEQVFHTFSKPAVILHPNGVFSSQPDLLEIPESEYVELPGNSSLLRCMASSRHQLLAYVSLLETNKPYIVDTLRVSAVQTLLMFAHNIDTNVDFTLVVCDQFIELKFPDKNIAQNLIFQAVNLRNKWKKLLDLRIQTSKPTIEDKDGLISDANRLEKELSWLLVEFFKSETLYAIRRLLAADVKVLYAGYGGYTDCILDLNPFSINGEPCEPNHNKGGVDLTDFLTYNCLMDLESVTTPINTHDGICPYCDAEHHFTSLGHLSHMANCVQDRETAAMNDAEEDTPHDPNAKKYYCAVCDKTFMLALKDLLKHKRSHKNY